nr:hypothetical protein [Tanacetum cinerariifolium]
NKLIDSQIVDNCKKGLGYNEVPPPCMGLFMPPKPDLFYIGLEEFTSEPAVETLNAKTSEDVSKVVKKDNGAPFIKDWKSDDEDESGNPQQDLKDKIVIDSGCSRHMIKNISYLTDYEEIDGGFVAFGGNYKGGKITGKGKIRTSKLEFKDVYFVKELKVNLFSVSQMCDKKNSVLFIDTACVVLSPDFKLTDESHVLLKVPRKDNMYSVDLKNVVLQGGLTCLFEKATSEESNLWHRRLGHGKQHRASCKTKTVSSISQPLQMLHMDLFGPTFVKSLMKKMYCLVVTDDFSRFSWVFLATKDETSEILKTFIAGIENLIDLRVKVIRCDNETDFKKRVMNQFCEMKDALTKAMNYKPVVVGNQSNGSAGTKACDIIGEEEKKDTEAPGNEDSEAPIIEEPRVNQEKDSVNSSNRVNAVSLTVNAASSEVNVVGRKSSIGLPDDPNMLELEDIIIIEDSNKDVFRAEADLNNLESTFQVSPILITRIHKDHPFQKVIGDLHSAPQTRRMNKLDERGIVIRNKAMLVAQKHTQKEGIDYDEVFAPVAMIKAIRKEMCTEFEKMMHKKFQMSSMRELTFFLGLQVKQRKDGIFISQDKYVNEILKKFGFSDVKTASTPIETHKTLLKDEKGDVDEHLYRSMIGSLMYITSSRLDIRFAVCACARFQCKKQTVVANSTTEAEYVVASSIIYNCWVQLNAVEVNPTIYTSCVEQFLVTTKVKNINGEAQLLSKVDGKKAVISEASIKKDLRFGDEGGIDCLPNETIFEQLTLMGSIASAVICLATNQKFNFSKYIFDSMVKHLDSGNKIFMYPRFNNPSAPQHTPLIIQPTTSKPQKKQKPRKPRRYDLEKTQPSGPTTNVVDEDLNVENVPTQSNDPPLSRVNTLRSGEDRLKLNKLMKLCTKLSERVLNLETIKTAQAKKISRLKKRVKRSKIDDIDANKGLTLIDKTTEDQWRINNEEMFDTDVFNDEEMFTESVDVAEQAKEIISDKDLTNDITLVKALMEIKVIVVDTRPKAKRIVMQEPSEIPTATTIPISSKVQDKEKGIMVKEPLKMKKKDQISFDEQEARRLQPEFDEQDRLAEEKAQQIEDENLAWDNVQAMIDADYELAARLQEEEQRELTVEEKSRLFAFDKTMSWINLFIPIDSEVVKDKAMLTQESSSKRAGDELDQERSKKQKVEDDKESEELKRCLEIILDDGDGMYLTFSKMLKNFDREDLEVLWRLVKDRFVKTKSVDDMDSFLLHTLKTMFEHHVEDTVWKSQQGLTKVKSWKLFYSSGVHCVTMQNILYYLLVEKMYLLTNHTLHKMFNSVKLQVDEECEMTYELLRLVKKQLKEGYRAQ